MLTKSNTYNTSNSSNSSNNTSDTSNTSDSSNSSNNTSNTSNTSNSSNSSNNTSNTSNSSNSSNWVYFLDVMKANRAWVGLILEEGIIFISFKLIYNGSISKKSHLKDSKYIFKENKTLLLFRPTDLWVSLRIMKQKSRAHVYNHTHTFTYTYMQTDKDDACM